MTTRPANTPKARSTRKTTSPGLARPCRTTRFASAGRAMGAISRDGTAKKEVPTLTACVVRLVGIARSDGSPDLLLIQFVHVRNHPFGHALGIGLFAFDIGNHSALKVRGHDMAVNGLGLPKAPAPADRLVELLV